MKTLESSGLEFVINGDIKYSMPNTLNVCMKGISSEALMLASKQYCSLSNGSACTSSDYTPSHVLKAMGISDEDVLSSIRISWSGMQDKEKIISGFKKVLDIARNMVWGLKMANDSKDTGTWSLFDFCMSKQMKSTRLLQMNWLLIWKRTMSCFFRGFNTH